MFQQWECEPQSFSYDLCTALPLWRGDTRAMTKKPPKADLFPTDQHLVEFHPMPSQVQGKHYIHPGHLERRLEDSKDNYHLDYTNARDQPSRLAETHV